MCIQQGSRFMLNSTMLAEKRPGSRVLAVVLLISASRSGGSMVGGKHSGIREHQHGGTGILSFCESLRDHLAMVSWFSSGGVLPKP